VDEGTKVRIFIESKSETIQSADMDTVGHPVCSGTNTSDWGNGTTGKAATMMPQEHRILLDAASRAAEKLGLELDIVDISDFGFFQRRKMKKVIPSIEIGELILTGLPTSDEIVHRVQSSIGQPEASTLRNRTEMNISNSKDTPRIPTYKEGIPK
jgi:hypothetical protein